MLKIAAPALRDLHEHAVQGYPLEICGFLVGKASGDTREVIAAWPVRNAWEEDPEARAALLDAVERGDAAASAEQWQSAGEARRFLVSPQDILYCMKRARQEKLDLVGVYHTHPNHPALPSEYDRAAAWPGWSYLILSVRDGSVAECRSWVLEESDGQFREEPVLDR